MKYEKCRQCDYICTCCESRGLWTNCSGCENPKDEFEPAQNIKFCPLNGEKLEDREEN